MYQIFLLLLGLMAVVDSFASSVDSAYLFAYFKNNGEDGLHLAYSEDGFQWMALKNDKSFLVPVVANDKLMRDPCIVKGVDGLFHMVWTDSWHDRSIGYASSPDLIQWSQQLEIPVMAHEPTAQNCWAPEIIYDGSQKQYMIYWATTIPGRFPATDTFGDNNHRIYYTLTKDFKKFTPPQVLIDPGFNCIDATIQPNGKGYVLFFKDETLRPVAQKNIRLTYSKYLTKGYDAVSPAITGNYWAEGPTVTSLPDRQWIVYFDKYRNGKYGALTSKDLVQWEDVSERLSMPPGSRHGTVLKISSMELAKLKEEK